MQKAHVLKKHLDNLRITCELHESRSEAKEAIKTVIAQLALTARYPSLLLAFPPKYAQKIKTLHNSLCSKFMRTSAGEPMFLDNDLQYLASKAQINKLYRRFWS